MDNETIAALVAERMLECDENDGDTAVRFFLEHILSLPSGLTYTWEDIYPRILSELTGG